MVTDLYITHEIIYKIYLCVANLWKENSKVMLLQKVQFEKLASNI